MYSNNEKQESTTPTPITTVDISNKKYMNFLSKYDLINNIHYATETSVKEIKDFHKFLINLNTEFIIMNNFIKEKQNDNDNYIYYEYAIKNIINFLDVFEQYFNGLKTVDHLPNLTLNQLYLSFKAEAINIEKSLFYNNIEKKSEELKNKILNDTECDYYYNACIYILTVQKMKQLDVSKKRLDIYIKNLGNQSKHELYSLIVVNTLFKEYIINRENIKYVKYLKEIDNYNTLKDSNKIYFSIYSLQPE